jgi:thiol-disulfide isomerase/thioredoxin
MPKILLTIILAGWLFLPAVPVAAETPKGETVDVLFFWGKGCPHCAQEEPFLDFMARKYPKVSLQKFEVWNDADNLRLLLETGKRLGVDVSGVPFTVVGERYFVGWLNEMTTGGQIEDAIAKAVANLKSDPPTAVQDAAPAPKPSAATGSLEPTAPSGSVPTAVSPDSSTGIGQTEEAALPVGTANDLGGGFSFPETLSLPVIGEIRTNSLSLPVLTLVLGALDGFNPCAMWTLLFLIGLLLNMQDKRRMWILGSAFIIASASVYFLFMAAWLKLLLFIGFVFWVRLAIGLVALAGGSYNLKEFFTNPQSVCKVTGSENRRRVFDRLKGIAHEQKFWLALGGIILLAFAVNLVELICSAGLPVLFTQILALSGIAPWQHYLYMLLYIFVFMLDDLLVFVVAMTTLQITGVTSKYSRFSHLIGGLLMLGLGLVLIFRPEWLMFG